MRKFALIAAVMGNISLLLAALFVILNASHDPVAGWIAALVAALAFLNLRVIGRGPDQEEIKLRRDLTKAELRLKLKTIEKEMNKDSA